MQPMRRASWACIRRRPASNWSPFLHQFSGAQLQNAEVRAHRNRKMMYSTLRSHMSLVKPREDWFCLCGSRCEKQLMTEGFGCNCPLVVLGQTMRLCYSTNVMSCPQQTRIPAPASSTCTLLPHISQTYCCPFSVKLTPPLSNLPSD